MFRQKFSLLGLMVMFSLVCLGLSVYELVTQSPLPVMPKAPGCVLGPCGGRVSDPLERVYIAGPADSQDTIYSPDRDF